MNATITKMLTDNTKTIFDGEKFRMKRKTDWITIGMQKSIVHFNNWFIDWAVGNTQYNNILKWCTMENGISL